MSKKIILSGIQATGKLTLGNYIGSIKQMIKYQDMYDSYIKHVEQYYLHLDNSNNDVQSISNEIINYLK